MVFRAAVRKGFYDWLARFKPDVVCIQETKAQQSQLMEQAYLLPGYERYFHDAQKKGYSGTAIFCKHKPLKVHYGLGFDLADNEGRYVQIDFKKLSIASIYMPSGTSGDERQAMKYHFLDQYEQFLDSMKKSGKGIYCLWRF